MNGFPQQLARAKLGVVTVRALVCFENERYKMRMNFAVLLLVLPALSCNRPSLGDWYPADINDREEAVGLQHVKVDDLHTDSFAVLYKKGQPLLRLPPPTPDADCSALAIANDGTIAGSCGLDVVLWNQAHEPTNLGNFRGFETYPTDINNQGVIVGGALTQVSPGSQFSHYAWVREPAVGRMTELPVLPLTTDATVGGINDSGDIVGTITADGVSHAVAWRAPSYLIEILPSLVDGPCATCATGAGDINSSGVVVGFSQGAAVIWPVASAPLPLPKGDHQKAIALVINDSGIVVGYVDDHDSESEVTVAARWNAARQLELLEQPAPPKPGPFGTTIYDNSRAVAINAGGVAIGRNSAGAVMYR